MLEVYREMLPVMRARGGAYAGSDIPEFYELVQELFTPEQAEINNRLPKGPVSAEALAQELGREVEEVRAILEQMADRGLCTTFVAKGQRLYQGARFMPGIFEFQFMPGRVSERDKKLARLIWDYKKAASSFGASIPASFPVSRVITVDRYISAGNTIHTYDQMSSYIDKYDTIGVGTCYCRHGAALRGEDTHGLPMQVCMWFGPTAEFCIERLGGRRLSKAEARQILDQAEEAGLVHMGRNTSQDIDFVCNCDRWHCEVITSVLKHPQPARLFNSGFEPVFDAEACVACGTCVDRCPPAALVLGEQGPPALNLERCFGCAACATGCPEGAISMQAKPGHPAPPKDTKELFAALQASRQDAG
ncbi:MAG: 4Fe-4S binding protein [Thermodesulfobacteriota bacterium]